MRIHVGDNQSIAIDSTQNLTVEAAGYEGALSRVQAPTYRVHDGSGNTLCEVKRHFFSNLPFFTIAFSDGEPPVKLSQEISEFKIRYAIQGSGLSFSGDFEKGDIDIMRQRSNLGHLRAEGTEGELVVDIQDDAGESTIMLGVGLAYSLMLAYLQRPLHAGDAL